MRVLSLLLGIISLAMSQHAVAADWTGFRGPRSSGVSDEKNLPLKWSDNKNIAWKTDLPGPGSSSPIVLGDQVFVTCYTGYGIEGQAGDQSDLRRHLLCIDRKSGKLLWDKQVAAVLPETQYGGYVALHGYASSTPATDGERVYVFFGKSGVLAFLEGKQLWKTSVGTGTHGWGSGASPLLYKNLVIVNANVESNTLIALDKSNGKEVWKVEGIINSWATPVLIDREDGKQAVVMNLPNLVIAYDPDTGKVLWQCDGIDDYVCPSVVGKDGFVWAIGGRDNTALGIKASGMGNITANNLLWNQGVGSNVTSPAVFEDHLYWVNDRGMAYCVKAKTGERVYAERVGRGSGVYASVVIADGKIYVVTQKGGVFVLAAQPKFTELAHNTLSDDSTFNGSLAISQGQLFLRSDKRLYCIGK